MTATQLIFDLPHLAAFGREDFLVAPSNEEAVALIDTSHEWGRPIKALIGPEASGKSHLAAVFSQQTGAQIFSVTALKEAALPELMDMRAWVIDDLHLITPEQEETLFHLYNHAFQNGHLLLLCSAIDLGQIHIRLPDLKSRLSSVETARLQAPCESVMAAVMVKQFHDRQIRVSEKIINYTIPRIERSFASIRNFVEKVDEASMVGKKAVTIPLISHVLEEVSHQEEEPILSERG